MFCRLSNHRRIHLSSERYPRHETTRGRQSTSFDNVSDGKRLSLHFHKTIRCSYCQRLAPTIEVLAESMTSKENVDKGITVATVDCTKEVNLCGKGAQGIRVSLHDTNL